MYTKVILIKLYPCILMITKIEKILNFGVFLSFFSLRFAEKFEYLIEKTFKKKIWLNTFSNH